MRKFLRILWIAAKIALLLQFAWTSTDFVYKGF